ncbi:MAG: hypothetical protein C4326_12665 [Ignavibacteria bacterium]
MRLRQVIGGDVLPDTLRRRLESNDYLNTESAFRAVKNAFPHHLVIAERGNISVLVKDRSVAVAVFRLHSTSREYQPAPAM